MSEKASGNETPSPESPAPRDGTRPVGPIGEEVTVDPEAGDLLDPVERWWDDDPVEKEAPRNRPLDPDEKEQIARVRDAEAPMRGEEKPSGDEDDSWLDEVATTPGVVSEGIDDELSKAEVEEEVLPAPVEDDLPPVKISDREPSEEEAAESGMVAEEEGTDERRDRKVSEEEKPAGEEDADSGSVLSEAGSVEEEESGSSGLEVSSGEEEEYAGKDEGDAAEPARSEDAPGGLEPEGREPREEDSQDSPSQEDDVKGAEKEKEKPGKAKNAEVLPVKLDDSGEAQTDATQSDVTQSDEKESSAPSSDSDDIEWAAGAGGAVAGNKAKRKKGGCWTVFTTIFFFGALLVLLLVGGAAAYAWSQRGSLEERISGTVLSELEKRGLFADYEGWRYQFPRGLILEGVTLYETQLRERAVLTASDVGINVDFVSLIRDRDSGASLQRAEVSFDDSEVAFFHAGELIGQLEEIDAEILSSPERVEVKRFEAVLGALVIKAMGRLDLSGEDSASEQPSAGEASETGEEPTPLVLDFSPLEQLAPLLAFRSEGERPVLELEFGVNLDRLDEMDLSGKLSGEDFSWKEIPVRSIQTTCRFDSKEKVAHFPLFQLGYGEGLITGDFSINTDSQVLTIGDAQSSVNLVAMVSNLSDEMAETLKNLEFVDAPFVRLSGTVPLESPKDAELLISYDHRKGLNFLSGERTLSVSNLRGSFEYSGGGVQTDDFAGSLFGGTFALNGVARLTASPIPYSGLIRISEMSLAEIGKYFSGEEGVEGLSGSVFLEFNGVGYSELDKIRGGGELRIDDAKLASFPIVGPVQNLLGEVVPAFGLGGEGSVRGNYVVESGLLLTNNLAVRQSGAEIMTNASLKLASQYVDFTSTARLQENLALATGLADKSIIVEGSGPLTAPKLALTGFPVDFASEKLSEILGTSPETLTQLRELIGGSEDAAKILGNPLEGEEGSSLEEGVRGLLDSILGGGNPEEAPAEAGTE